jgi:hypothetical protein
MLGYVVCGFACFVCGGSIGFVVAACMIAGKRADWDEAYHSTMDALAKPKRYDKGSIF